MDTQAFTLKPERLAELETYARSHGQTPADALDELLAAQLGQQARKNSRLSPEEWTRELDAWGKRNAARNLPVLPNEALRRESLYEDRGL